MAVYLALFFIYSTTIRKAKAQKDLIGEMLDKDKKRRNRVENTEISEVTISRQKMIIELLRETLYINYEAVFEKREVDSEFFKKYC